MLGRSDRGMTRSVNALDRNGPCDDDFERLEPLLDPLTVRDQACKRMLSWD